MSTIIDFTPTSRTPFQFNPTLDGQVYAATITWSLFGARYYFNLNALDGSLVVARALVGSPIGFTIDALSWWGGRVLATVSAPHGYKIGDTIALTVSGCVPIAYNGIFRSLIVSKDQFTYPLAANPGLATQIGNADYDLNLVGGFFNTSTLVYRDANKQFIISP